MARMDMIGCNSGGVIMKEKGRANNDNSAVLQQEYIRLFGMPFDMPTNGMQYQEFKKFSMFQPVKITYSSRAGV